jgi:hypothetical protein
MRHLLLAVPALALLGSCDRGNPAPAPAKPAAAAPATLPPSLFLTAAPADAKSVEEVKQNAKAGDTVVLRGRIGGGEAPFVEGRAVFTIVGAGLAACADDPEDTCKTPWDYCCETPEQITAHAATIQAADDHGNPLKADFKGSHGLKELSDVTIVGTVARAESGAFVVNASGLYLNN